MVVGPIVVGLGSWEPSPSVSKPSSSFDDIYLISDGTSGDPCSVISRAMCFSILTPEKKNWGIIKLNQNSKQIKFRSKQIESGARLLQFVF